MYLLVAGFHNMGINDNNYAKVTREKDIPNFANSLGARYPEETLSVFVETQRWQPLVSVAFSKFEINDKNEILPIK